MFKFPICRSTPFIAKLLLSILVTTLGTGASAEKVKSFSEVTTVAVFPDNQKLVDLAKLAHQQVNKYRSSLHLPPLTFSAVISQQAMLHSQNMAQQTVVFSHDGFSGRLASIKNDIAYRSAAENVAYNMGYQDPVSMAVAGWIESDGHRQNMEGNYNLTGIGVAVNSEGEYYFTQIFILEN